MSAAGARSPKETRPHSEDFALNPVPEKPATWIRPGSRDGQDWTGRSRPSPADQESPTTTTRSPAPVTIAARFTEAAANRSHFDWFAFARAASTPVAVSAHTSAATVMRTVRRRGSRTRGSTSQVCGPNAAQNPWSERVIQGPFRERPDGLQ